MKEFFAGFNGAAGVIVLLLFVFIVIPVLCCCGFMFVGMMGQAVDSTPTPTVSPW